MPLTVYSQIFLVKKVPLFYFRMKKIGCFALLIVSQNFYFLKYFCISCLDQLIINTLVHPVHLITFRKQNKSNKFRFLYSSLISDKDEVKNKLRMDLVYTVYKHQSGGLWRPGSTGPGQTRPQAALCTVSSQVKYHETK